MADDYHLRRREFHGPSYQMVQSDQLQTGDPQRLHPHGVPPGYEHPQPLGPDVLDPGGPRIMPVSQQIEHGPERSRDEEFEQAIRYGVGLMAVHYGHFIFKDRRIEGRRYRGTNNQDELAFGPQEPYPKTPHGGDIPFDRYQNILRGVAHG